MVLISDEKLARMRRLCDARGIVAALAIDQRGTLQQSLAQARNVPLDAVHEDMAVFKTSVTRVLGAHATAVLLDVDYGMNAIAVRNRNVALLLAYEKWGYDQTQPGRVQQTLEGWSVRRLVETGADWIKILLFYTPSEREQINERKRSWIRQIGQECRQNDVPFCLEPLCYDPAGAGEASAEFARRKPQAVTAAMREFSKPEYHVDLLKVEIPVNLRYVEGTRANNDGPVVHSRSEALGAFQQAAAATELPFVYLSAGVDHATFLESLELAAEAGVAFNGVLCGRATWKDAIPVYASDGVRALEDWLHDHAVRNMLTLNSLLARTATPWWHKRGLADQAPGTQGQRPVGKRG